MSEASSGTEPAPPDLATQPEGDPAPARDHTRPSLGPAPGPILPTDPFAVAGRKAMWLHVSRMLDREAALRDPSQTDSLKRYRVATRRLRAAMRVFRDAYPRRELKPLRAGLAELAATLGKVRDLDVRVDEVDTWAKAQGHDAEKGVEPLRVALRDARRTAGAELERKLATRGHDKLLARLVAFVTEDEAEGPHDGSADRWIRDRAASSIWTAYEQVRAYALVVPGADLPTLHGLRIEAKRLRYTIEFMGPILGPEHEWLVDRLVGLQDHLGGLNDTTMAVEAVDTFLAERHEALAAEERVAVAGYLADRRRERSRLRRSVGRAWRPVVSMAFARRLGRAVVVGPSA